MTAAVTDPVTAPTTPLRWSAVWSCALLVLGSLSLATAWTGPVPALCLAVAAVLPLVVCRGVLRLGVSAWATATVLVSLLVLAAYVLAADAGTSFSRTVTDAVPRLLTTARPLPAEAEVLVGPLLLAALMSLLVALRLESQRRVAPVVGALVLYLAGVLLTTGAGDRRGLLAALLVGCTLVGWVVLDDPRHRAGRRVGLALVAALVATGVLLVSTTVRWSPPFEPRSLVDPPTQDVVASNPLALLGSWASDPERELLEVSGAVTPLRLVTLDTYDGGQWSAGTRYLPVTETRDADPLLGSSTRASTVRVAVAGLTGRWLPSPGWPTDVSASDALVEPVSGNLYLPEGDSPDGGLGYTVTAVSDDPDTGRLASATVPYGDDLAPYLALPPLPQPLSDFADRAVAGAVTPYDRAVAIERALRDRARLSPTAVSGSQLWRISLFLLAERGTPGARTGTAEQFATSFAVLARHNGLPTRVVVGFRPDDGQAGNDGWTVRGRHATAWAEVYFQDLGWVPFSPTDARRAPLSEEEVIDRGEDEGPGLGASPDGDGDGAGAGADDGPEPAEAAEERYPVLAVGAGLAGGVVAVLGLLLGARAVRSWRQRRRGAGGAWAGGRDALRLAGVRTSPHQTPDQVAALAGERLHTDAVHVLAAATQRAAFGPPGTSVGDPGAALRDVRRVARRSVPRWRRWWWHVDPTVFVR